MKLYLAGPMAGYYNYNASAFDRAKESIVGKGHDVVSPVDLDREDGSNDLRGENWEVSPEQRCWFLRRDFQALLQCDGIVLLDEWEESRGANLELLVAISAGLEVFRFHDGSEHLRPTKVLPHAMVVNKAVAEAADILIQSL